MARVKKELVAVITKSYILVMQRAIAEIAQGNGNLVNSSGVTWIKCLSNIADGLESQLND